MWQDNIGVWRIHLRNDISAKYTRADLINFCKDENLIGVGWQNITTKKIPKHPLKSSLLPIMASMIWQDLKPSIPCEK